MGFQNPDRPMRSSLYPLRPRAVCISFAFSPSRFSTGSLFTRHRHTSQRLIVLAHPIALNAEEAMKDTKVPGHSLFPLHTLRS
jgi:hypothetical protein